MAAQPKKANESRYCFICNGIASDEFFVREFTGYDRCSELYTFDISLASRSIDLAIERFINQRATLYLFRDDAWLPYSGIITSCTFESTSEEYGIYRAHLRPALFLTTLTTQCRVFQKMSVPEIIAQILEETGLATVTETMLDADYPQREYIVQYNETDYNFICRLMEANGIWYHFREDPVMEKVPKKIADPERMIITDTSSTFSELPFSSAIKYRPITEMVQVTDNKEHENIYQLHMQQQGIPAEVIVKNYRYATPEVDVSGFVQIPGGDTGSMYHYGGSFDTVPEAEQAATIIAHRIASSKMRHGGKSICKGMRAGYRISVVDHPRSEFNQSYIITAVTHHEKMQRQYEGSSYGNEFEAFPTDNASIFRPQCTACKPAVPEIITARIEGEGPEYATLDNLGRYKLRMPFDLSTTSKYQASSYIRLAQLYSGTDYGSHLPPHEGAEMIIAHVNGDPDRPVGLKVVPDGNTISPVTSSNHTQSIIRTAGKNEICMDDNEGKEHLKVYTPGSMVQTAGHDESESTNSNRKVTVGGDEKKSIGENATYTVKGKRTMEISGNRTADISGSLKTDVTAAATAKTSGNHTLEVTGNSENKFCATRTLEVTGNHTEKVTGTHAVEVTAMSAIDTTGNCSVKSAKDIGAASSAMLIIKGTAVIIKGNGDLGIGSDPSSLVMTSDGIAISGPTVTNMAIMIESSAKTNNNVTGLVVLLN